MPVDELRASTLRDFGAKLLGHEANINGNSTWFLPLGIWHRRRKAFGVQYCAMCLRTDRVPYFRRSWRIANYTQCEHHNVLLADRCPNCSEPVMYFRAELGRRYHYDQPSMRSCAVCGWNLSHVTTARHEWPEWKHEVATRTLLLMQGQPWALVGSTIHEDGPALYRVLRQLIAALASPAASGELYDRIADVLWPYGYSPLAVRGTPYEMRSVWERHILFGMAVWLLLDWPDRFREVTRRAKTPPWSMTAGAPGLPDWYLHEYRRMVGRPTRQLKK